MGNEKMYCEKCGHEMKNGRCPNCGFPVGEPQWEEQKSKKKSGKSMKRPERLNILDMWKF